MSRQTQSKHAMRIAVAASLACASLVAGSGAAAEPASVAAGAAVYNRWCVHCHSSGRGNPGTESLQVKYAGKLPAVLLDRTDLAPEVVARFVRTGVLSMPPFRKTEISDAQIDAVSAYLADAARKGR